MTVNDYYKKINSETSRIFDDSTKDNGIQSLTHDLISNLQIWHNLLSSHESALMLLNSIEELDISCLQMMQGVYRGAFASLRLSLEMLCGSIYFSAHNIEYKEWTMGNKDLMWSNLSCPDNGILSKRFSDAYFPELSNSTSGIQIKIKTLYRQLSEMVHGNNKTWNYDNPSLSFNESLRTNYKTHVEEYTIISNYVLCLRFLNFITPEGIEKVESHIIDHLSNIEEIRIKIGGQKNG